MGEDGGTVRDHLQGEKKMKEKLGLSSPVFKGPGSSLLGKRESHNPFDVQRKVKAFLEEEVSFIKGISHDLSRAVATKKSYQ